MSALNKFIEKLDAKAPIQLDGAFRTELVRRGFDTSLPLFAAQALIKNQSLVKQIHRDYIATGTELLTANSFYTALVSLKAHGLEELQDALPDLAVTLAFEAVEEAGVENEVLVAGSLAPLSSYFPGGNPNETALIKAQEDHATRLAIAGAEIALCETMPSVKEAAAALKAATIAGMKTIISIVPSDSRHIISGETIDTAVRSLIPLKPLAICFNCSSLDIMDSAIATLLALTKLPVGVYAHIPDPIDSEIVGAHSNSSSARFLLMAERWKKMGVQLLGGCCGTTPTHIKDLHDRLFAKSE